MYTKKVKPKEVFVPRIKPPGEVLSPTTLNDWLTRPTYDGTELTTQPARPGAMDAFSKPSRGYST